MNSLIRQLPIISFLKKENLFKKYFFQNYSKLLVESNVVTSKVPNISIPNISLSEYVWKNVDKWYDKTAIQCAETGRTYLYSDIYKKTKGLANFLNNLNGLHRGDTVAIIMPNVPEFPIILMGAIETGLKVTPINPLYTSAEIANQLLNSQAKLVFTTNKLWPDVKIGISKAFPKTNIPVVFIKENKSETIPNEVINFEEIAKPTNKLEFRPTFSPNEVIILPYSSGTTGLPKGVELTMKNIVSVLHLLNVKEFRLHEETSKSHQDIVPGILPMYHIFGMVMLLLHMFSSGCKVVTLPKFTSTGFINLLDQHKPSLAYLVPPIILMMINNPNIAPHHITQIRNIICGAASLGAADIERFHIKSNRKVNLMQGYGLTETSPTTHQQSHLIENGVKLGGIGFALPNTECKIVSLDNNNQNKNLGCNLTGELYIRGPQVMKGYHNNLEATKEVLDSNGWFRTGDIAYYDENNHFYITDRLKELIKVKGYQVAPAELEEILRNHPDITDAAVVGVSHNNFGEVPKAFVVLKNKANIDLEKIDQYVSSRVAKYKKLLGGIVILEQIPKSPAGKILRRKLKKF